MSPVSLVGPQHLGQRTRWVLVLPSAALGLYTLLLIGSGAPQHPPDAGRLRKAVSEWGAGEAGALVALFLVLVVVLQPLQQAVVRLLTGDWGDSAVTRVLCTPGLWLHRSRRKDLQEESQAADQREGSGQASEEIRNTAAAAAARLQRMYPPADDLLPSLLGNVLRAGQRRAGKRYGLEAGVVWPRIYPLLPQRTAAMVDDQRDQLDICMYFCGAFLSATLIGTGLLATHGVWLLVTLPTLLLAFLCYRAAVAAAALFGDLLETAFDLYRFDLLRALHLPLPPDRNSERDANDLLSQFLLQGRPVNFVYDHPEPPVTGLSPPNSG